MLLSKRAAEHIRLNKGGIIAFDHDGNIISRVEFANVRPDGIEKEFERFYFECTGYDIKPIMLDMSSEIFNPQYNPSNNEDESRMIAIIHDSACCLIIEKDFNYQKGIIDVNKEHLKEISNYLIKLANSNTTKQHKRDRMTRLSDSYECDDYSSFMKEVKDYAKEMKVNKSLNNGSQLASNVPFDIPEKKVKTRTVTRVFVESSRHSDDLEREIDNFLSTRKFISQTSSTAMSNDGNLIITVVVIAEEEINN